MTNLNERTNTLLYKNIPLTLYSRKVWCCLCERSELETGTDCCILTQSSSEHSITSFAFWLGCSSVGHWGPKAPCLPLALSSASCPQLTPTATGSRTHPSRLWHLVIILFDIHQFPVVVRICHHDRIQPHPQVKLIFRYLRPDAPVSLFFRLFTQVHLLIDGSVEGQYVTHTHIYIYIMWLRMRSLEITPKFISQYNFRIINHKFLSN